MIHAFIEALQYFNHWLFYGLYSLSHQSTWGDQLITFFGDKADVYVVILAMIFILVHQHQKAPDPENREDRDSAIKEMGVITIAVLVASLISILLKEWVGALRPFQMYDWVEPVFAYTGKDGSFPSGHATFFSALSLMITMLHRKAGVIFVTLAMLISLARVIDGIHFPVDLFVGWLIGGFVSYFVYQYFYGNKLSS